MECVLLPSQSIDDCVVDGAGSFVEELLVLVDDDGRRFFSWALADFLRISASGIAWIGCLIVLFRPTITSSTGNLRLSHRVLVALTRSASDSGGISLGGVSLGWRFPDTLRVLD